MKKLEKSKLIVLEGVAGGGKTTLINALMDKYKKIKLINPPRLIFEEQGNTLTVKPEQEEANTLTVQENIDRAMFFLDGMIEAQKLIKDDGAVYLADRWYHSTLVYQIREILKERETKDSPIALNWFCFLQNQFLLSLNDNEKKLLIPIHEKIRSLTQPTHILFLKVLPTVAIERKRAPFDETRYNSFSRAFDMLQCCLYYEQEIECNILNTTHKTIEESVNFFEDKYARFFS